MSVIPVTLRQTAGGPSFQALFSVTVLKLWVARPCVLCKGGYDAADSGGSSRVIRVLRAKSFTVGSPVPALRNIREGRGTHSSGGFRSSRVGPPAQIGD